MSTYIVIEINEKENALDIMNILMTHTKARFIVTTDIQEYAQERETLKGQKISECPKVESSPPPAKRPSSSAKSPEIPEAPPTIRPPVAEPREASPDIVEIEPPARCIPLVPKMEDPSFFLNAYHGMHGFPPPADPSPMLQNAPTFDEFPPWQQELQRVAGAEFPACTPTRRGRPRQEPPNGQRSSNESWRCAMCGIEISVKGMDFQKRSDHAVIHTELRRYICPSEGCGIKSRHRSNMSSHVAKKHPRLKGSSLISCMSPDDEEELKLMTLKCFPELVARAAEIGLENGGENYSA